MNNSTLSRLAFALCLLAPWSLVWLDTSLLFPYITGKSWFFRVVVELAFALSLISYVFRWPQQNRLQGSSNRVLILYGVMMVLFLIWTAISDIFGLDSYRSFWSNWERMGGLLEYLHWAMYLFCLLVLLDRQRSRLMLLNLLVVVTLVAFVGLLDGEKRSISTLGNPIYLGNLTAATLFVGAFLFFDEKPGSGSWPKWVRWLIPVAMLLIAFIMVKSASRGPMVSFAAGALVACLGMAIYRLKQRSLPGLLIFIAVLCVLLGLVIYQLEAIQAMLLQSDNLSMRRLGKISMSDQTTADRLENWKIALEAATSKGFMGWGQENYMIAFNDFYRAGVMDKSQLWFDRAHNGYLDVFINSGIPGLTLYLLLLCLPVWMVWRVSSWSGMQKAIMTGFFTAFVVKNIFVFDTFSSTLVWLSCIALLMGELELSQAHDDHNDKLKWQKQGGAFKLFAIIVLFVCLLSVYWLNVRPYQDNKRFMRLMSDPLALRSQELSEVLELPLSHMRYGQNAKLAVFDRILIDSRQRRLTRFEQQRSEQLYQQAGNLVVEGLKQQPADYRLKYNGAMLTARLGNFELAIQMLEELTRDVPSRTVYWHTLARVYGAKGEAQSAAAALETASQLNPDWKP